MIRQSDFVARKKSIEAISPALEYVPLESLKLVYYGKENFSQIWLKASCGLIIEMDLLFSTYGGIQRVSSCCFAPAQLESWAPQTKPVCTCCGSTVDFTSQLYTLINADGQRNDFLTADLTNWLENCFPCLEDQLVALTIQEEMESIFTQVIGRRHEYFSLNLAHERKSKGHKLLRALIPQIVELS